MASNSEDQRNKPVVGYGSQLEAQVSTGHPTEASPVSSVSIYSPQPPPSPNFATAEAEPDAFCGTIASLLYAFLVMAIMFMIVWLMLLPRLPEVRVTSAEVSSLNATASRLTANWNMSILVTNPNGDVNIYYESLEAAVLYGDGFVLGQTELAPFYQPRWNDTQLDVQIAVVGANASKDVVQDLLGDERHGSVSLRFRVLARVKFPNGGLLIKKHTMLRVICYDLNIGYSPNSTMGSLLNPGKKCEIEF